MITDIAAHNLRNGKVQSGGFQLMNPHPFVLRELRTGSSIEGKPSFQNSQAASILCKKGDQ
ncbi:hypothetical protein AGR4B_pAt10104 [Agrobacterium tumefaciens str. CFBP 5621]|nr:hypothetical protein AGR4B_pAt10104 [Agrobacterium tumefaciens str. CFBP 5621]